MVQVRLEWLITDAVPSELASLLAILDRPVTIYDAHDHVLLDGAEPDGTRYPIHLNHDILGWVIGQEGAESIAMFLTYAATMEHKLAEQQQELENLKETRKAVGVSENDYFQQLHHRLKKHRPTKPQPPNRD